MNLQKRILEALTVEPATIPELMDADCCPGVAAELSQYPEDERESYVLDAIAELIGNQIADSGELRPDTRPGRYGQKRTVWMVISEPVESDVCPVARGAS